MSADRRRPTAEQVLAALNAPASGPAGAGDGGGAPSATSPSGTGAVGGAGAVPPPAAAPGRAPRPAPASRPQEEGSIKETVESILVAFVLAFIFRAFVVEAFVIPTGSMAPTLLGAHMRYTCQDCGYPFEVNYTGRTVGDDVEIPTVAHGKVYALNCPNCGLKVPKQTHKDADDPNDATAPPVHYGDRILVLKYAYLLSKPSRWDVVVFKTPDRSDDRRQVVPPYTVNYIKRLVALPGESVFILDGDVYTAADPSAEPEGHRVRAKPRAAQEALWRIVYDNDYRPEREAWRDPWAADGGGGWAAASRVLRFDAAAGAGWLRFDADANEGNQALTDWLAYAATKYPGAGESYEHRGLVARNNVSDLKLSLFYQRLGGDGPLRLRLTKLDRTFTAELTPGKVRLLGAPENGGDATEIGAAPLPADGHPLHVEFMNVDYRVTVRVNGRDLLSTTPEQYRPDMGRLIDAWRRNHPLPRPEVRIGAEAQACTLSHVSLWRDVYYTNRDSESFASDIKWGTPRDPMRLGDDEYWVLGDNSLMSGDGRYWGLPVELEDEGLRAQPGVVPGRFLLGKAFFVYWPAGYRLSAGSPGVVPNFGDMRFIH